MSTLPRHIKEKILTTDFLNSINEFRRQNKVKIAASDPHLIGFLSRYLGVPEEEVKKHLRQLIMLIGDVLSGRVKLRADDQPVKSGEPHIHANTLSNTLYFLLSKISPTRATKVMYEILEPYVVRALAGDPESLKAVDVFFSPVSSSNYRLVVEHFKHVLSKHRELCGVSADFHLLCMKSAYLPVGKSANSPANECLSLVAKAASEVCQG